MISTFSQSSAASEAVMLAEILSLEWAEGTQEVTFVEMVKWSLARREPRRDSEVPGEPTG